jgi:metal transporter CNNM
VAVNALLSIFLANLTSGLIGFFASTIVIVIFGEIVPQALCSRHALKVGALSIPIVKVIICLMYPMAKPVR